MEKLENFVEFSISIEEKQNVKGGFIDQCGLNRWAAQVCRDNNDYNGAWRLDMWYDTNCRVA